MLATIRFRVFLSSCLLSRNVKVKIYKTIILPVVLYGCETWSLTLREEHWGCLRTEFWEEYLDLRRMMWWENGGSFTVRNFIICTHPQISLGRSSQGEWGGQGMWHTWERTEKCTRFWWESPKESDHLEDHGVDGIKICLGEIGLGGWIGSDWPRIGAGGELLWMQWWTFRFLPHRVSYESDITNFFKNHGEIIFIFLTHAYFHTMREMK
jgi:hypothetical protein